MSPRRAVCLCCCGRCPGDTPGPPAWAEARAGSIALPGPGAAGQPLAPSAPGPFPAPHTSSCLPRGGCHSEQ